MSRFDFRSDFLLSRRAHLRRGAWARPFAPRTATVIALALAIAASSAIATVPATSNAAGAPGTPPAQLLAWGGNDSGQAAIPAGLTDVKAFAAGGMFSIALKRDGTVVAWGSNEFGETDVPPGLSGVIAISAGDYHSMALKGDGTVVGWGRNEFGQTTVPPGLSGVTAISAGGRVSMALKSNGTVVVWGMDWFAQPTVPAGLTGVVAISDGAQHSLALKNDGTVVAWGDNTYGETLVPAGLTGVKAISAGGDYSLALKIDGTVVAWGGNLYGQTTVPAGLTGVTAVAAGYFHSLALKADGSMVAWGWNDAGQAAVPASLGVVLAISAGIFHTLVLAIPALPVVAVVPPPTAAPTAVLASVMAGVPLSKELTAPGTPGASFAVAAGQLPTGLNLDTSGVLSGTPTVAGSFTFNVTASNGKPAETTTVSNTIVVTPGAPVAVHIAPQSIGSNTFTATAGTAVLFAASVQDQWGNVLNGPTATFSTNRSGGAHPDVVSGNSVTFYTAGVNLVTATIDGLSSTLSVATVAATPVTKALEASRIRVPLGGSSDLTIFGTDAYGNIIDLTSRAVFTSDWAVDVFSGAKVTFPHASPHVITATVGSWKSSVTIEVVDPPVAVSSVGRAQALAFTGSDPLPTLFGGAGLLLLGLLTIWVACLRRRGRTL